MQFARFRNASRFKFFTYPKQNLPQLDGYILLTLNAPPLTEADSQCGLLIIDATWRYAEVMERQVLPSQSNLILRSLPATLKTAYPRRQEDCHDPARGLASLEAIYAAYKILRRDSSELLQDYYWRDQFLDLNEFHFR